MSKKGVGRFAELAHESRPQAEPGELKEESRIGLSLIPPKRKDVAKRQIVNLGLDPELVSDLDKIARHLGMNRTELIAQILTRYRDLERAERPEMLE